MADQMDSGFDVDAMRIVAPDAGELERAAEAALRPKKLSEFVGQRVVRGQLQLVLDAARMRSASPDHVLLCGPSGTRQDDAGNDHRGRDGNVLATDLWTRDPARW